MFKLREWVRLAWHRLLAHPLEITALVSLDYLVSFAYRTMNHPYAWQRNNTVKKKVGRARESPLGAAQARAAEGGRGPTLAGEAARPQPGEHDKAARGRAGARLHRSR